MNTYERPRTRAGSRGAALGACVLLALTVLSGAPHALANSKTRLTPRPRASARPAAPAAPQSARKAHAANPTSVTIPGSLQSELGCPGDWDPACANTHLAYDAGDDVWQGTFNVPAGSWEYKAAIDDSWTENYGLNAQANGANIPLNLGSPTQVKFYYDHKSHWVTSNRNSVIATVPGNFQSEIGCGGDWDPSCLRSWLQDTDGDGIYTFQTSAIPAGDYECKVAINESWDENYGQGGVPGGANIPFNVAADGTAMLFSYDATSHVLTVGPAGGGGGDVQFLGLRHDTFDSYYRAPFGAVPAGASVTLRFRTDHFDVDGVSVRVYTFDAATGATTGPTDYPMAFFENRTENGTLYDIWTYTLATPSAPSVLYYKFRITDQSDVAYYSDSYADDHDNANQGGEGAAADGEPFPAFQITAYAPGFQTPSWLHAANVYHIFPDRFRNGDPTNDYGRPGSTTGSPVFYGDPTLFAHTTWNEAIYDPRPPGPYQGSYGNQFFGGDLEGIRDKLDYLRDLGVDTLYLNPIFAGRSNHRYDTDDYFTIDPALGGDAAFDDLVKEAERRGVRLILDGVFNHASSDSFYFDHYSRYAHDGACESLSSPYRSWFNFFNNDAPCDFTDYEGWFGFGGLPVFNETPQVRSFFFADPVDNVTRHWYERGASGWRFDVANEISHDWWKSYRPYAKAYKADGPLVGEIWPDASQFLAGDQLDSVMNYRFRKNVLGFVRGANWSDNDNSGGNAIVALTPSQFDHALRAVREDYPAEATAAMLNLLDSHDTNRALYTLALLGDAGPAEAKARLRLAALFQFTYLGAPMVYYGDEGALDSPSLANGPNGPEDDPYNRAPYPWSDEGGDPNVYGPVDAATLDYYTKLGHLRKQFPVLRTGAFETLLAGDSTGSSSDDETYAFARTGGGLTAVVALNRGASAQTADVPVSAYFSDGTTLQDPLTGTTYSVSGGVVPLALGARSGVVLLAAPAALDLTKPTVAIDGSPDPDGTGNSTPPVTVTITGADSGSGVKELRYWVDDGPVVVVSGGSAMLTLTSPGTHTVSARAIDNADNVSAPSSLVVQISPCGFSSDFSGAAGGTPAGWGPVTGTWQLDGAGFYVNPSGPVEAYTSAAAQSVVSSGDESFTVRLTRTGAANGSPYGVVLRGNPTATGDGRWETGYFFTITRDAKWHIFRLAPGGAVRIATGSAPAKIVTNDPGNPGQATNTLRVVASGATFRFYANNMVSPIAVVTDATYGSGQTGVCIRRGDVGDALRVDSAVLTCGAP